MIVKGKFKNEMMARRKFFQVGAHCTTLKTNRPFHGFGSHLDEQLGNRKQCLYENLMLNNFCKTAVLLSPPQRLSLGIRIKIAIIEKDSKRAEDEHAMLRRGALRDSGPSSYF